MKKLTAWWCTGDDQQQRDEPYVLKHDSPEAETDIPCPKIFGKGGKLWKITHYKISYSL